MIIHRIVGGLAMLAIAITPALAESPNWTEAKHVEIDLSDHACSPAELHLHHGVAYVLHFSNTASQSQDFSAPEFFLAADVSPDDRAKIVAGGVNLDGGQHVDVKLVTRMSGNFNARCARFMHAMPGMIGKIVID